MLAALIDVAQNVGYFAIFGLIAIETLGVPVPGETALITGALLAGRGKLHVELVIALAAAGAILGDNVGFTIGRHYGRRLLTTDFGPFPRQRKRLIEVAEPFFERHGPKAVFLGRWFAGLRITSAWMAGASRMGWLVFLFWNALGGVAWAASVGLAVYFAGHSAETVADTVGVIGAIGVVVTLAGVIGATRMRRRRPTGDATAAEADRV
ncbi:MAG TPA: DedA family protein [Solirubrobacteraceae bacterium]|nr:DedA family protein [Solirubrobacteraceae bacterium]